MLRLMVLVVLVVLSGCAKRASYSAYAEEPYESGEGYFEADMVLDEDTPMSRSAPAFRDAAAPPGAATAEPVVALAPRMVHYNGYLHLRVTDPSAAVEEVADRARALGGYVENLSESRVTVRVPVDRFEESVESTASLGDVIDRSITAEDVTEAYTAVDLRLQTAQATRKRLVELLARAGTEEEKLSLLRQIQRVSEEIDLVEAQLRTLARLASHSRLTVDFSARSAFSSQTDTSDVAGLDWIARLSPFRRDVGSVGRRLELPVPEGLVALAPRGRFIAESADGAVVWTGRLENQPRGSADFWIEAIAERLAPEFAQSAVTTVGGWQVLRLEESETGYRYLIAVMDAGRRLKLVEIYYPAAEQEQRYGAAILAALGGGEG